MIQIWILRQDINPVEASKTGADKSICGECPHRHFKQGACYVNLGQAPNATYKAYKRGIYPKLDLSVFKGRAVRFGAYGDPMALPVSILSKIASVASKYTGYTHQWEAKRSLEYKPFLMASVDNELEYKIASNNDWRSFRVSSTNEPMENEILCPSESKGTKCIDCGLCNGSGKAKNIYINVHGSRAKRFAKV